MQTTEMDNTETDGGDFGSITLIATGRHNEFSDGSEVFLLGVLDRDSGSQTSLSTVEMTEGWTVTRDVDGGPGYPTFSLGLRGTHGQVVLWPPSEKSELLLLRHPWSGIANITINDRAYELDLYSPETELVVWSIATQAIEKLDVALVEQAAFLKDAPTTAMPVEVKDPVNENMLRIRALGESNPKSLGTEVCILEIQPLGYGIQADLGRLAKQFDWISDYDISIAERVWPQTMKASSGEAFLRCDEHGSLFLLRHAWSGLVEITFGDQSMVFDLYCDGNEVLEVPLGSLKSMDVALGETAGTQSVPHFMKDAASSSRDAKTRFYENRLQHMDPSLPTGLFVPRWKGVALSTETLLPQALPIPHLETGHPDDITDVDTSFYADMLLASGIRHFVISGGDTFNLDIIHKVRKVAPDTRFDLLWHSNYLQMGEAHDWQLLRHWIRAAKDGIITRIAVVKAGMEDWFQAIGLDAVFIPNMVPFDVDGVQASTVQDCVGIWLSGSTQYRKMPHASIVATTMLDGVALKASGLDGSARRLVADARTPFRQIWADPLPREQLHKEMRETGLTFYVTLSECSPMLPLESFSLGVPCLVGPASHLFRDHEELSRRLIVMKPMSPGEIAEKARDALASQAELMQLYRGYYRDTEQQIRDGVAALTR
ncbi:MAG: hypothetical protein AAF829_05310 [Pseudomonadota bacterium]